MNSFNELLPNHVKAFKPFEALKPEEIASNDNKYFKIKEDIFNSTESISIDYGILEKAKNRIVIPGSFGWTDLGSWKSIDEILIPRDDNNRCPDTEKSLFVNSENCSTFSEDFRISVVGCNNITVIQAGNDILVIDKDCSQDVRKVVEIIKSKNQ